MAADQDVGGIALGLQLDTTGWSSGIARAKAELEGLRRSAGNIEIGVGVGRGGVTGNTQRVAGGPAVIAGIPSSGAVGQASPVVSPRFQVSAGSVRQLRTDINAQLRQLSAGGEAVQVPVRLGRVPWAAMRSEIAAGIGMVPIRVTPDAGSLTAFAAVLSAMTGQTPGRSRQAIASAAASRGIPTRAQGGPASPNRPHLVGENGPEIHWPSSSGTYIAPRRSFGGSVDPDAYTKWALERDRRMGGAGRIKISPAEISSAGRGMVNLAALRREGMTDPARLKMHREFYDIERRNIEREAKRIGVTGQQLTHVTAATSSNQPWDRNVAEAIAAIKAVQSGKRGGFANAEQLATTAAILAGQQVTGIKRLPFAEAFYDPNAFPIDRWMGRITTLGEKSGTDPSGSRMDLMRALRGKDWSGKDVPSPAHRRASVFGIEQMAKVWGIDPREAQAEPWGVVRDLSKEAVQHFKLLRSGIVVPRRHGGRAAPLGPGESMPPELGTAPLRPGYVRGYHGTRSNVHGTAKENLDSIRAHGLKISRGLGHEYGEPDMNWFSNDIGDRGGYNEGYAVEAHLPEHWFRSDGRSRRWSNPSTIGGPGSNMAVGRDISARRFATYNEPWMRHYRYMNDAVEREGMTPGKVMRQYGSTLRNLREKKGFEHETRGWDQFVADQWRGRKRADGGSVYDIDPINKNLLSARAPSAYRQLRSLRLTGFSDAHREEMEAEFGALAKDFPWTASKTMVDSLDDAKMQFYNGVSRKQTDAGRFAKQFAGQTVAVSQMGGGWGPPMMRLNTEMGPGDFQNAASGTLTKSMADLVAHEFGHAIDFSHGFLSDPGRGATSRMAGLKPISSYGARNQTENFAEMFLAHRRGIADLSSLFDPIRELEGQRGARARGGAVKDDFDMKFEDEDLFEDPLHELATKPTKLQLSAYRARAMRHLRGQGYNLRDGAEWISQDISSRWGIVTPPPVTSPLVLRTSGRMVDVADMSGRPLPPWENDPVGNARRDAGMSNASIIERMHAEVARGKSTGDWGPDIELPGMRSHNLDPITKRLPKGVKIRFSPEWSDYPDPSRFIGSGGPLVAPDWHDKWKDPGQLNMGYFDARPRSSGGDNNLGSIMRALMSGLDGDGNVPAATGPFFDPRGEADPLPKRWDSLSDWLKNGRWGERTDFLPSARAKLVAYALNQKNQVLGHAMVGAGQEMAQFGPQSGNIVDALHPEYVWTSPEMRGQGLASAMYSRLEKLTGMPVMPSSSQTAFGKRLWSKPSRERSFGRMFGTRQMTSDIRNAIMEQEAEPAEGIASVGWRRGWAGGAEPYRDFSNAVDPLDRVRPRLRARGQMKLPGFAKGGFMFRAGRPLTPEDVMAWETQLRETAQGPKFMAGGQFRDFDPRMLPKLGKPGMLDDIFGDRKRALGGATKSIADMGSYIIGEIGRELFIPKRMEGIIPADVAAQIPGTQELLANLMTGRARAGGGGVKEIGGRGSEPWDAPEDGWIIPNRLMHRIPRHKGGQTHQHPHLDSAGRPVNANNRFISQAQWARFQNAQRGGQPAGGGSGAAPSAPAADPLVVAANRTVGQLNPFVQDVAGGRLRFNDPIDAEGMRARGRIQMAGATERGLSARQRVAGLAGLATGGAERREAAIEARIIEKQIENLRPVGMKGNVGMILEREFARAQDAFAQTSKAMAPMTTSAQRNTAAYKDLVQIQKISVDTLEVLGPKLEEHNQLQQRLTATQGKAVGNAAQGLLSVTAAGVAFSTGMQAVQLGIEGVTQVAKPLIDQLSGFTATNQRITKDLADSLPQAGTLRTLVAQRGMQAGVGAGQLPFFESALGGGVYAKAGATAAGQAGDLFRSASSGAPTGLIGGYGGLFGGSFGAELMGGGKGLLETIAGTSAATSGASTTPFIEWGPIGDLVGQFADGIGVARRAVGTDPNPTGNPFDKIIVVNEKEAEARRKHIDYVNDAILRGQQAQGGAGGGQLRDVGVASATAMTSGLQFEDPQTARFIKQFADSGQILVDQNGDILDSQEEVNKVLGTMARGLTVPDRGVFAATQAQNLVASSRTASFRGEMERGTLIPGQLGQQVAANPFMSASAGLAAGFEPVLVNLKEIQSLQDDITRDARAGIEAQASFIAENLGGAQASQFSGYMATVSEYGAQIASLNEQMANKQAALGFKQYTVQLNILNRQIRDAKGLAGQGGGSQLGGLQREQWQLSRESQRLQLESQRLANEMSQRQINFQVAVAGFQAPGITGQERAARMEEAKVEASFAQRQLDIQKQQTGIGGQQFGIEGQVFALQTQIAVQDLENQRELLIQSHALEQEQLAVQKQISALTIRQSQVQAKAQSLFAEATGNFDARLGAASAYVAQFGGTVYAALGAVRRGIDLLTGGSTSSVGGGKKKNAMGAIYNTTGEMDLTVGEAGTETVAILRNPRRGTISAAPGGGGGGGNTVQITITGNNISNDMDLAQIARVVGEEVEDRLSRKANLIGSNAD